MGTVFSTPNFNNKFLNPAANMVCIKNTGIVKFESFSAIVFTIFVLENIEKKATVATHATNPIIKLTIDTSILYTQNSTLATTNKTDKNTDTITFLAVFR